MNFLKVTKTIKYNNKESKSSKHKENYYIASIVQSKLNNSSQQCVTTLIDKSDQPAVFLSVPDIIFWHINHISLVHW